MTDTPISQRLKSIRQAHGWSQRDLARETGLKQPTISRLESGDIQNPRANILIHLCRNLHLSADDLLGLNDDDSTKPIHIRKRKEPPSTKSASPT